MKKVRVCLLLFVQLCSAEIALFADSVSDIPKLMQTDDSSLIDCVCFGDAQSESACRLSMLNGDSESGSGVQGQTFRRINAPESRSWTGGSLKFVLKVVPDADNYLTVKFWGSQTSPNSLILYFDGKQMGYRHLGDYDCLHHGCSEPPCPGQFYYVTTVLPRSLTDGKTELETEIRLIGRTWGYGANFEQFQKAIEGPSLDLYAAFTHRTGYFDPADSGLSLPVSKIAPRQAFIQPAPVRTKPGAEILDRVRERINRSLERNMQGGGFWSPQQMEFEAQGWRTKWTVMHRNPKVLERTVQGADEYYRRWLKDETLSWRDPGQYNNEWFGIAPMCQALVDLDSPELQRLLDEPLNETLDGIPRRQAYARLIEASRDRLCCNRRQYTNQSMIIDWNIYRMNRGMAVVDPQKLLPEPLVLGFLHESVGLTPWLGAIEDEMDHRKRGADAFRRTKPLGGDYYQLTCKGLTRELGYVGSYGEVLCWVYLIYRSTGRLDAQGVWQPGDAAIRNQLVRMSQAREPFRFPAIDIDGFRTMRLETSIGWRDVYLVGPTAYGLRPEREGSPACVPWITRDAGLIQSFQTMVRDNQFFRSVEEMLREGGLRIEKALMEIPEQYAALMEQNEPADPAEPAAFVPSRSESAAKSAGLPMAQKDDFLFTDEQNGVVALKYGNEILYASLYWRARNAVNFLSKVHLITPTDQRHAIVRSEIEYTPQQSATENAAVRDEYFVRPNWTTFGFANGGGYIHFPDRFDSIHAGERLPIARVPDFVVNFKPGQENIYAGRGDFYRIRYGKYGIAMNLSESRTFELDLSKETRPLLNLVTGKRITDSRITVPPQTTVVFVEEK